MQTMLPTVSPGMLEVGGGQGGALPPPQGGEFCFFYFITVEKRILF